MIKEQCIIAEIKKLNLTKLQKNRMFRLVDVVDINKKRKVNNCYDRKWDIVYVIVNG